MRTYVASGRNGYWAVDQYRPQRSGGTYGNALIFRTRKDADKVAAALNEAYEAGRSDVMAEVTA
jgi:hypothetical protein